MLGQRHGHAHHVHRRLAAGIAAGAQVNQRNLSPAGDQDVRLDSIADVRDQAADVRQVALLDGASVSKQDLEDILP